MYANRCIALILTFLWICGGMLGQEVRDSVRIHFRQGSALLDPSYGNNRAALHRIADSMAVRSYTDSVYRYHLKGVTVIGGASPEGGIELNRRLSEKRANVLFDYLSRYDADSCIVRETLYLGRDWQGLLQLVMADADVPHREEVVTILQEIIGNREQENSNFERLRMLGGGDSYRYISHVLFPQLRATQMVVTYGKTAIPGLAQGWTQAADGSASIPEAIDNLSSLPLATVPAPKPCYMALKTNLLYNAALTPNIGAECYLGGNWSVAADWMYAWWSTRQWCWRTYGGDIAIRRWWGDRAKEKPLTGHHAGVYAQALTYDFLWNGKGYMAGEPGGNILDRAACAVGVEYGYSHPVTRRMNIDFTLGIGYMWGIYYEYAPEDDCYVWQMTKNRRWLGPTKAKVSLVWLLGRGNVNVRKGGGR